MLKYRYLALFLALPFLGSAQSEPSALLKEFHFLDSITRPFDNTALPEVMKNGKRMLEIANELGRDTLMLQAKQTYGQALEYVGVLDEALRVYYEMLSLAETKGFTMYQMRAEGLIGRVYHSMNDLSKSQSFYEKARLSALRGQLYSDTISLNYDIGFNMAAMGDMEGGIRRIEQSLADALATNNLEEVLFGYDNLFNIYTEMGDLQKAMFYAQAILKIPEAWEDDFNKAQMYEHQAEIYAKLKDWDQTQKYQKLALEIFTRMGMNDWIYECYKLQSLIDEGRGNFKGALENHRLYLTLKDSVYQEQYDERMAAMSAFYELEKKQQTITVLKKDQEIQLAQIQEQRLMMFAGVLALLLVILFIRFQNQRKTQQMQEAFGQALMGAQEQERERISKELHDSVGQNILFVKNRLQRISPAPDESLVQSVDTALEEVRNIAKDLYPNQLELYGLSSAVDSLCALTHESSGVFVSSDLTGIDEKLNREAKINCYRIIQECINNTLKHAEASAIRISANLFSDKVELMVQDNGKGFDKSLLERKSARSFGMINIAERIKMLRGKFDLETAANKGTKFTFSIPV